MMTTTSLLKRLNTQQSGATLTELLIGMVMLSVVATGVLSVTHSLIGEYSHTNAITSATSANGKVFLRLEKQVRYARRINPPSTVTSAGVQDAYVEMLLDTPGTDTCVQWRVVGSSDTLQTRQWLDGGTAPVGWTTVAANVANDVSNSAQLPFVFTDSGSGSAFQRLDVHLYIRPLKDKPAVERQASFIARNSDRNSVSSTVCRDTTGKVPRP